jgi:hypothetical protein
MLSARPSATVLYSLSLVKKLSLRLPVGVVTRELFIV